MTLEKKLVRLRKKEGMSQADVSEKLNVSRQAVSRWEAGDSRPSTENLQALCKLYNVKLDDLLDESNEEVPIEKPECQKVECDIERKDKGKRHVWAKRGVIAVEMSRNVQSGNTQNLKSTVIQRSFPKWSVAERRKTAAASDQAAVCACTHSRYFAGGSPIGLRV